MSKKDTRSIAYIFNEMDPSEEVEFLREIECNSNLLIEVETLRRVNQRIKNLPEIEPPVEIVNSVQDFAKKEKAPDRNQNRTFIYSAVAALVAIGITSGIFIIENPQPQDSGTTQQASVTSSTALPQSSSSEIQRSDSNEVLPWIDNNEVLHFNGRSQFRSAADIDSIFNASHQKLTPVNDPVHSRVYQNHFHLTGNRR